MSRRSGLALTVLLVVAGLGGCREEGRRSAGASTAASASATTTTASSTSTGTAGTGSTTAPAPQPSGPPPALMGPAFRLQIARAFAPQLRFNAYHPGSSAPQNRNEDLFPMGVASFLRELHGGRPRVLIKGSSGTAPGESREQLSPGGPPSFGASHLGPYPTNMVGDPPGTAPLYVNVYEDPAARVLDPQGRGHVVVHVEYWLFYPQDRADVVVLGNQLPQDPFGHQGDWEHVAYRIELRLGADSRFLGGTVLEGYYSSHGDVFAVKTPELELVDDRGDPDPAGRHPVVYVSQGKHGAYPQAGERRDLPLPPVLANFVDFFRGNGVVVDSWNGPFFDLEDTGSAPQEFASPAFRALLATPTAPSLTDWTEFQGRWGPTLNRIQFRGQTIALASSPSGPKTKSDYGDFGASATSWVAEKANNPGSLTVYRDTGQTFPRVLPPPLPIRR